MTVALESAKRRRRARRRKPRSYWALRIGIGLLVFYVARRPDLLRLDAL